MTTTDDPWRIWREAHPQEAAAFAGRYVAFDPARGVIASGDTVEDVVAAVDALEPLAQDRFVRILKDSSAPPGPDSALMFLVEEEERVD